MERTQCPAIDRDENHGMEPFKEGRGLRDLDTPSHSRLKYLDL